MSMSRSIGARLQLAAVVLMTVAAAASHAESRFKVSADGKEVQDTTTNLTWARCAEGAAWDGKACAGKPTTFDFRTAKKHAAAVGQGWRLPTRDELVGLVDKTQKKKPKIDITSFPNTPSTLFWASRQGSTDDLNAWLVHFGNGKVQGNLGERKFPLRLVRSAG